MRRLAVVAAALALGGHGCAGTGDPPLEVMDSFRVGQAGPECDRATPRYVPKRGEYVCIWRCAAMVNGVPHANVVVTFRADGDAWIPEVSWDDTFPCE